MSIRYLRIIFCSEVSVAVFFSFTLFVFLFSSALASRGPFDFSS